jgi:hypothetical protein
MATFTLLEMTQNILSALSSDEVSSISDTVESLQVANIIKGKYYDMVHRSDPPQQNLLFQMTASGDSTKPTLMLMPSTVSRIDWIKYYNSSPSNSPSDLNGIDWTTTSGSSVAIGTGSKTFTVDSGLDVETGDDVSISSGSNSMYGTVTSYSSTTLVVDIESTIGSGTYTSWNIINRAQTTTAGYQLVTMLTLEDFLNYMNQFSPSDDAVGSYTFTQDSNDFTFYYYNDRQPKYCTILSNYYTIFDSYDSLYDSTLQASKTLVFGEKISVFNLTDNFTPDLNDLEFSLLLNEAKATAFYELKQQAHPQAEREIKRQWSAIQKNKEIQTHPTAFERLPNFGRKRGGWHY